MSSKKLTVAGILTTSTVDVPDKCVSVIFTCGCNFNCKFCHNHNLIGLSGGKSIEVSEIITKLEENYLIDGFIMTGGEPTLQPLESVLYLFSELSDKFEIIGLDTNGSNPKFIENILPYINRIAVDFKGPIPEYHKFVNTKFSGDEYFSNLRNLINITKGKNIMFEIRTTYIPPVHSIRLLCDIRDSLIESGFGGTWIIQQFRKTGMRDKYKGDFIEYNYQYIRDVISQILDTGKNIRFSIALRSDEKGYEIIRR